MMSRLMLNLHESANTGILWQLNDTVLQETSPLDFRELPYIRASPSMRQATPLQSLPEDEPGPSGGIYVVPRSFDV
jgi:hypothetical protein